MEVRNKLLAELGAAVMSAHRPAHDIDTGWQGAHIAFPGGREGGDLAASRVVDIGCEGQMLRSLAAKVEIAQVAIVGQRILVGLGEVDACRVG